MLAAGTDRTLGPTLHQELGYIAEAGIAPFDIIRIATLNAAYYVGRDKDLGSIEAGKLADMVLLDADPAANVANFARINTVIKDGKKVDRSKLDLPVNKKT
ncbi:MAG: amidohydrolase family protein [Alphaproteobacteria bacterium]|nr:amidohydrolase family protein [Alphaproteobacteria bacterium]